VTPSIGAVAAILDNDQVISVPPAFVPEPAAGRVFAGRRLVRSTDVTVNGRLRLDALARYLQLVAEDDVADAGLAEGVGWLVRRSEVTIRQFPAAGERLSLRTFCSGTGPRWAERTTTLAGPDGDLVQARAVWAAVGPDGRPVTLSEAFLAIYGPATGGRIVSARLSHPRPELSAGPTAGPEWPLRVADFDTAGHVNNAVYWQAVEDVLAAPDWPGWLPTVAEIEYHRPTLPGAVPRLLRGGRDRQSLLWLVDGSRLLASVRLAG
jgi:acyl-ACP thioesterase